MEYTIDNFVSRLREIIYDNFPFESDDINNKKHAKRPLHIRDIAFGYLPTFNDGEDKRFFDIGSDYAEEYYPYYHILQDSEVIHIKGRGTKTSKGSQERISDKSARDYGHINWNGKTYSREYVKNVRGARSRSGKARRTFVDSNGVVYKINENASTYVNIHYKYIDRILDNLLPWIAMELNMTLRRKQDTGIAEEYARQELETQAHIYSTGDDILDILDSFE